MGIYIFLDNTLNQALIYGLLALSVYVSLRLLDFPDLTIEGSFPLGAAIAGVFAQTLGLKLIVIPVAVLGGFIVGMITAVLHERLQIGKLLSGILVAIGLYSINFRIMGAQANLYILKDNNLLAPLSELDAAIAGYVSNSTSILIYPATNLAIAAGVTLILLFLVKLLRSQKGALLRFSRSDSTLFLESIGINTSTYVIIGIGLANSLAALAGALVAFQSGTASTTMGFGIILVSLVSLVIGEQIVKLFHKDLTDLYPTIVAPIVGAFAYYTIIRAVRWLNSMWQIYSGYPEPTDQLQFFNSDIRILSVIIMVLIYLSRRRHIREINIPERL